MGTKGLDQNDSLWTGDVLIFSASQVTAAQALDSALTFYVIEDDNTKCVIKNPELQDVFSEIRDTLLTIQIPSRPNTVQTGLGLLATSVGRTLSGFLFNQDDDIVGVLVEEGELGLSYADATHAIVLAGQPIQGRVNLVVR